ncbi:MAG: hypothetical protein U5K69_08355 [Balneolaceae bacterium]|nr:hypothetical protein [Balneolaceae bacterium]
MKQKRQGYIPGARESNAGDNFHELWACSKAIELLNPESSLKQLVIEDLSEWDLEDGRNNPYLLLGVDMAEYYGGKSFKSCERIVISQVKYSHRNSQKDWTLSRLTRLKGKRNPHSLIKRLADSFNFFHRDFGREVKNKLKVKLVSNQNISRDLIEAINEAKDKLNDGLDKEYSKTGWFIKQLTDESEQKINELYHASGLSSESFLDFIQVLDFSDCGLDDRIFLRLGLIKKLSDSVTNRRDEKLTALVDLIKKNALPEKRGKSALQKEDVLTSLNVSLPEDLFPASPEFEAQDKKIEIQDHKKLADHVKKHQKTILHGVAGTGKTTTLLELRNHLSKQSKVIYYDCYGGGDYLEFGQHRHLPSRAYLQIANQLAIECNMPFLIHDDTPKEDLERELKRRIVAASELVKEDGGILVIAIDAADNSVEAAQKNSEDYFVHRLWDLKLPQNCRLVMSSRSGARLQSLQAPTKEVAEFKVGGFKNE